VTPDVPQPAVPEELERVNPRTRTVLAMAQAAAGNEPVTRDHLLAAMLDEDGGLGVIILDKLGVELAQLRAEV
jgi:hypothetical protein